MATTTTTLAVTEIGIGPNGARLFRVPSRSNPGEYHAVAFVNNTTSCTCDGSLFRGHCAHGKAVENFLIAERRSRFSVVKPQVSEETRRAALAILTGGKVTA